MTVPSPSSMPCRRSLSTTSRATVPSTVPSPSLPDAGKVRQLVAQSGGHQDPAGTQRRGPGDSYLEAGLDADHGVVDQAAARAALRPAAPPPTTTTSYS